ncbi:MAG TPA: GNAT family N-acetyltransferase [Acidimicrobiales bacterium]|jgi:GNAT superfamily N-acetyltransferase|nr:GNAT family N-acetyltransferase [Acidimicrobiales bacterium]
MEIRPVRTDEWQALGELTVAAYAAIDADALDEYAHELRDVSGRVEGAETLVAVDDAGAVLGGVTYVPDPGSPWAEFAEPDAAGIRMLAVAPEAQGRGIGEALSRACVDRARAAGKGQVLLHSTDRMAAAHRIYERLGFVRDRALDWEPLPGLWLIGFRLRLR